MAIPAPEALQRYWNWLYEQNREEIESQVVEAMITGRSFVKMAEDGVYRRDYWNEVFNIKALPEDNEPEPVICGFGEAAMYSQTLKKALDELTIPVSAAQLDYMIGDRQHGDMFFAMDGMPRAYMEIPTDFPTEAPYGLPPILRVVYSVLAYRRQLRDGEDIASVEPELVACMWDDMKRIRVKMAELYGEMDPVLFWRRHPEVSEQQDEGDKARFAQIYMRLAVPGYDFAKHPTLSFIGRDSSAKPFPRPVPPAQKDEMLFADEVLKLSAAAEKAHNEHYNAFQKLINMRSQRMTEAIGEVQAQPAFPGLYGAGQVARNEAEQMKITGAMRALLDSQAIASRPSTVSLNQAAPREDIARVQEQLKKLEP